MNLTHARILAILVCIVLGFSMFLSVYLRFSVEERNQELAAERAREKAIYAETMKQRAQDSIIGEDLYERHCGTCHGNPRGKHYMMDRFLDKLGDEYFGFYVSQEDSLLAAKDPQAININEYTLGDHMHAHNLTPKELNGLIKYLKLTPIYPQP